MKAISLWQPWASLWCSGIKRHETRHWPTDYRGWLLVHAAKRPIDNSAYSRLDDICASEFGGHWGIDLARGAIVGAVHLVDCMRAESIAFDLTDEDQACDFECGDFSPGRYGWRADQFRLFKAPIPYRGLQGFFRVPEHLLPAEALAA